MQGICKKAWLGLALFAQKWWKKALICLILSLALGLCMEWLQIRTQPIEYTTVTVETSDSETADEKIQPADTTEKVPVKENMRLKRAAKMAALLFVLQMALFFIHGWTRIRETARRVKENLFADKKNTLIHTVVFFGSAAVAYLLLRLYIPYILEKDINWIIRSFILSVSIAVGFLFCFRKTLAKKAEIIFLVLSLLIGGNIAFFAADTSRISWDDGYHYLAANSYSYLGDNRLSFAETNATKYPPDQQYEVEKLDELHAQQNADYKAGAGAIDARRLGLKNYWSGFSGIGLYLGRVLGFPFHLIWEFGRFAGLLAYSIIGYYAIRRLKSGKMILASVLMIPENLFLAANYSYDPGVTIFIALGMAYYFAEWQEPEKKLTWFNTGIMIGALFVGCYTKAIYFPLLLFPLFLPKSKFENPKQRLWFIGLTIGAMLLLILSFALPMIRPGASEGDKRGGEDVNASRQIAFILSNPLEYTRILTGFLKSYLHPDKASSFLSSFAYYGKTPNSGVYLVILAMVIFTDKNLCDNHFAGKGWMRALLLFAIFGTMCLVATSMYIMFTPVGLDTINGCQPRYMLPLFFPTFFLLGWKGINNRTNRTIYNGIVFALAGYVGFTAVLYNVVNLYY